MRKEKAELEAALIEARRQNDLQQVKSLEEKLKILVSKNETDAVIVSMLATL